MNHFKLVLLEQIFKLDCSKLVKNRYPVLLKIKFQVLGVLQKVVGIILLLSGKQILNLVGNLKSNQPIKNNPCQHLLSN